jgi:hypothetical protein
VKADVFVPRMSGPTMSLEEYGDMQLQQLQDREAAAAQREMEGEGATRR